MLLAFQSNTTIQCLFGIFGGGLYFGALLLLLPLRYIQLLLYPAITIYHSALR